MNLSQVLKSPIPFLIFIFLSGGVSAQITDFKGINFEKADSVAALHPFHSIDNLKLLSDNLTGPLPTQIEKFRAIYRWVCENIENDYGLYKRNKVKREKLKDRPEELSKWNKEFNLIVLKHLIKRQQTVCTGYAYLVKELAYHAGINCEIVNGYGRTIEANIGGDGIPNHSWNAVELNKKWYLCDPTWSSGSINISETSFIPNFNEGYFLADPSLFSLNHYPLETNWLLVEDKPLLSSFLNGPLVYKGALNKQIYPRSPEAFEVVVQKGEPFQIAFGSKQPVDGSKVKMQLDTGNETFFTKALPQERQEGYYSLDYTFISRGSYVIHVLLEDEYILTYHVKVIK